MNKREDREVELALMARTETISDLVQQCADGEILFSGPNSLCQRAAQMGFKTTGLFEMVRAAEARRS